MKQTAITLKSARSEKTPRTLAVDIGGSGIKAVVLDAGGTPIKSRIRVKTPRNSTPRKVIAAVRGLAAEQNGFERVSVGFPGVIKKGVVYTAPTWAALGSASIWPKT
jgi:polyphosphate glucokinase